MGTRMGVASEGKLNEMPTNTCSSCPKTEVVCGGTRVEPLLLLELLRQLMVSMSLGCGSGNDAPFEELSEGELRGGICERYISQVAAVAGAMCVTEVVMQLCAKKV